MATLLARGSLLLTVAVFAASTAGCRGQGALINLKHSVDFKRPAELSFRVTRGRVVGYPVDGRTCSPRAPKIALIPLDGPMLNKTRSGGAGENPVALFREQLDAAATLSGVCAVVLRINSPGGSVTATEIMADELRRFRARTGLPVFACLMDVGTGGAYYLATGADLITAYPTTITGGIGVVLNLYNMREAMATLNIAPQMIKSGQNIDMGSEMGELPEEHQWMLQQMADEFHLRFINVVRSARPRLAADAALLFDGRVLAGTQALEVGLIDRLATLPETLELARQAVGKPDAATVLLVREEDRPRSIYSTPYPGLNLNEIVPLEIPGVNRAELPLFLYIWQPTPIAE